MHSLLATTSQVHFRIGLGRGGRQGTFIGYEPVRAASAQSWAIYWKSNYCMEGPFDQKMGRTKRGRERGGGRDMIRDASPVNRVYIASVKPTGGSNLVQSTVRT